MSMCEGETEADESLLFQSVCRTQLLTRIAAPCSVCANGYRYIDVLKEYWLIMAKKKKSVGKKKSAGKKAPRGAAGGTEKYAVPRERLTGEDGEVVKLYGRERCIMPGDDMQQRFGDNCKVLRVEQGFTVQQFADKVDIHRTTVHRLEARPFAHRTSVATAVRIAKVLGESVENMCTLDYSQRIS